MKAKLIVEGQEFDIEINDPKLQKLVAPKNPKKETGYENVGEGHIYYYVNNYGEVKPMEHRDCDDDNRYSDANYYLDCGVAENNARADKLMRQLRRFAVEHRTKDLIDWGPISSYKWCIFYDYGESKLCLHQDMENRMLGSIYFESKSKARDAIKTFHDELIWYFTEYKDSL